MNAMLVNIRGKSLLSLKDFRQAEIEGLLALARELKAAKSGGKEIKYLEGKSIALIFEKNSTHTRIGFEVAAYDQGAHVTYLGPSGTQLGRKESMKDTARVLGRIYDGIEYRGYDQKKVTILADHAGVPVFNGLTDQYHPTQILADLLTMQEHVKRPLKDISFCYIGDARNNMGHSLLLGGAKMGMNVRICAPPECQPEHSYQSIAHAFALDSGASVLITDDPREAVVDCDFIYTDAWVSMGESEEVWQQRIELLKPYQVNHELLEISGNLDIKFMHCLPALHNTETELGQLIHQKYGLDSLEVTEEVFESSRSIVFDQAENRMHTIKAVLVASLYGDVSVKDEPLALNKF